MKKQRRQFAKILLSLFLGLSAATFFMPEPPPSAKDEEIRLVAFEEADDNTFEGLLRSVEENQEENTKTNNFFSTFLLENFHSVSLRIRLAVALEEETSRGPSIQFYLFHSSLLI